MTIILGSVAVIISILALFFSLLAYSRLVGLENSTHKIQFVDPSKQEFENLTDEIRQKIKNPLREYDEV